MTDAGPARIIVDLAAQRLQLLDGDQEIRSYAVSTALRGAGEQRDSQRTPRGLHIIRAMIGAGLSPGAVLVGRRPTGEVWSPELARRYPGRDWILSRILWLSGTEVGRNRLGAVDSMQRYIYIHGTPESEPLGQPASHGCVRMKNADILELFDLVRVGTPVDIREQG